MASKVSAKQAAIAVLSRARKPMAVKDVVAEVLSTPGVSLKGKTPGATIAAALYTGAEFKKTGRGMIALSGKAAKPTPRPRLKQQRSKNATTKKAGLIEEVKDEQAAIAAEHVPGRTYSPEE